MGARTPDEGLAAGPLAVRRLDLSIHWVPQKEYVHPSMSRRFGGSGLTYTGLRFQRSLVVEALGL